MKNIILSIALVLATGLLFAQKKTTTAALIEFDATTSPDKLSRTDTKTATASLDTKTGKLAFEGIVKDFTFIDTKMQAHFNSAEWMDSDKFPIAGFKGTIINLKEVNFTTDGKYNITIKGELTMHGVTRPIETTGEIVISRTTVYITSGFTVKLEDYGVNGAAIAAGKVPKEIKISVAAEY